MSYELRRNKAADGYETRADALQDQISDLEAPMTQNWTHRRQGFQDSKRIRAEALRRVQDMLRGIAVRLRANTLPPSLVGMTKTKILSVIQTPNPNNTRRTQLKALQLVEAIGAGLRGPANADREAQLRAEEAELAVRGHRIQGFFPTPDKVVDEMLSYATLGGSKYQGRDMGRILEPSAGIGSIIDGIYRCAPASDVTLCEINYSLRAVLEAKGYTTKHDDIFNMDDGFDTIIMNPPFEQGAARHHIRHCFFNLLNKGGGRLVAVVPGNGRQGKNDLSDVIADHGYTVSLADKSFQGAKAFRSTGICTSLVVLDR